MIERAGECTFEHTLHGGQGPMTMQWHFFEQSRLPVAVQTWELPPGASEGLHAHDPNGDPIDELYLVLAGNGRMHVGDAVHDLGPGDSVLALAGVQHDLVNTGDSTLRVLVIWGKPAAVDWSRFGSAQAARRALGHAGERQEPGPAAANPSIPI